MFSFWAKRLIDQGCRTLKSSGRTWLFLVRYLLYGFTGVGLNPTKSHYYKAITCPVRDDGVDDVSVIQGVTGATDQTSGGCSLC